MTLPDIYLVRFQLVPPFAKVSLDAQNRMIDGEFSNLANLSILFFDAIRVFANFCQAVRPIRNGRSESRRLPGQRLSANYLYSILSTFIVLHFNLSFT